ncbi:DoxX family protein [Limobrevibacterium gyesilva]|uniref:DoxX family protein n=1 Tax=Limobrevibacterium gyesilva TaxID=2991712 RepID=A0AA41YRS8_9PROT|nr:DoxX family protein [Limobrevibacterium gyesilva]MCW3475330.1 DoxX family protein [Limobrevibacterium gyesilva]
MSRTQTDMVALLGRILMSVIFINGGLNKLMAPAGTIKYIAASGLPMPEAAYAVAVLVELGGGLAILLGFRVLWAALALAGFCLVTATAVHYVPGDRGQMINFWKNLTMAGGFLQLAALGGGGWSIDAFRARRRREALAA